MNSHPRVMLLTGSPPGDKGVGQIIVKEICRHFPQQNLFCFATLNRHETWQQPDEFSDVTVEVAHRRYEHHYRPGPRPVGNAVAWAGYRFKYLPHCKQLTQAAIEFGREHRCDLLFSILESSTNIQITDEIAKGLGIPKHILVWDAPDFIATHLSQTPLTVGKVLSAFDKAMSGAKKLAVVSTPMAEKYQRDYGLDSVMLRHAAPAASQVERTPNPSPELVIGFAGSVSARPQLELLQQTLDQMDWLINDRPVRLDLYGMRFTLESRRPRNVLYRGYRSVASTVKSLAESADVLFMPQPFDEKSRSFTELSFPTKLSTYFAAQRPILLLSPDNSSLGKYFQEHAFGSWCNEMSIDSLRPALVEVATEQRVRDQAVCTMKQLLSDEFNSDVFQKNLHEFLVG